jgi:type IV pilus assembly protein PilV
MFNRLNNPSHNRQRIAMVPSKYRGDTMIEVLVTVLILAVGVLGVAAMQVTTYRNLSISHSASIAAIVADDFAERMRANLDVDNVDALTVTYNHSADPGPGDTDCTANACSPSQLADYDIGIWWEELGANLPLGRGQVARNGGTNTFTLTVRWDEDRSGSAGTNCPKQSAADLECYQLQVTI